MAAILSTGILAFSIVSLSMIISPVSFSKQSRILGNVIFFIWGQRLHGRINSTFGGNLVDMVRFTIYLEIIEQENLLQKSYENGKYLLSSIENLEQEFSGIISNARGKGLWCAYDLPNGAMRDRLTDLIQEEGAIILGAGHKSVRFRPHLNISKEEIDIAMTMMRSAIAKI